MEVTHLDRLIARANASESRRSAPERAFVKAVREFQRLRTKYHLSPEGDLTMAALNDYGQRLGAPNMDRREEFDAWMAHVELRATVFQGEAT